MKRLQIRRFRAGWRALRDGALDDSEVLEALEHVRELHTDLTHVIARLERRLDREQTPARDWDEL